MSLASPFLSCDWGTSSLRIRWIRPDGTIRWESAGAKGCKALFDAAKEAGQPAAELYEQTLRGELEALRDMAPKEKADLVISGMASSTIGWRELPYLVGPLKLDGSNLRFGEIEWRGPAWLGRTFLISGVAIHPEMMRGEETEAIGLLANRRAFEGTLILPGTHSKHLTVREGEITAIATHMTGELFEVLSRHSILKASVSPETPAEDDRAFEDGVRHAAEHGLARSLFRVRTRAVLDGAAAAANTEFLSGLLIGAELAGMAEAKTAGEILLAGAGRLGQRYVRALRALGRPELRWSAPSVEELAQAVPRAHALFLANRPPRAD